MRLMLGMAALLAALVAGSGNLLALPIAPEPASAPIVTISDTTPPSAGPRLGPKRQKLGPKNQKLGQGYKPRSHGVGSRSHGGGHGSHRH